MITPAAAGFRGGRSHPPLPEDLGDPFSHAPRQCAGSGSARDHAVVTHLHDHPSHRVSAHTRFTPKLITSPSGIGFQVSQRHKIRLFAVAPAHRHITPRPGICHRDRVLVETRKVMRTMPRHDLFLSLCAPFSSEVDHLASSVIHALGAGTGHSVTSG